MVKVATCWDDGVTTDIRLTEMFRKYNVPATFNLCPAQMLDENRMHRWVPYGAEGWRHHGFDGGRVGKRHLLEVYKGFQVASHCMNHETVGFGPTLAEFTKAAVDARKFLEDTFQQDCPGFAWPCGRYDDDSVKALADAGFAYGRTCNNLEDIRPTLADPLRLASNCHYMASDFKKRFEKAKAESGVFYFWGHSYEMYDCEGLWDQLEQKIAALCADPDVRWCNVVDLVRG